MFTISKVRFALAVAVLAGSLGCNSASQASNQPGAAENAPQAQAQASEQVQASESAQNSENAQDADANKAMDEKVAEIEAKIDEASSADKNNAKDGAAMADKYHGLIPFSDVKAPEITKVTTIEFKTDAGDMTIEVYPEAAPNAAQRFVELCKCGFYDDTPIFRIVNGFVAQFGINWRPNMKTWKDKNFNDDPSLFELGPATLAFAKAGPNTNSTQVFINYGENSMLRDNGNFTTFGRITKGFEVSKKFVAVGDASMGLDQGLLWANGEQYLQSLKKKPNMIISAKVVGE